MATYLFVGRYWISVRPFSFSFCLFFFLVGREGDSFPCCYFAFES